MFDLREHSSTDLARLDMAIGSGLNDCGNEPKLNELRETLLTYRNLIQEAYQIAVERESKEFVQEEMKRIIQSN